MPLRLSILVPVYNEVATVETLLRRVADVRFPIEREIVVVDDGSTDGSGEVLARLAWEGLIRHVEHEVNAGKGAAIRTAAFYAEGQILVVQDADLELDPEDLPSLLEPISSGEAEVCYGTRFASPVPRAIKRLPTYWANRILNWISNRLNGMHLSDFNTCYKMMTAGVMARMLLEQNGFGIEPEVTAKLARMGYRVVERPIRYTPRGAAAGKKIALGDVLVYLASMFRYRFFWSPEGSAGETDGRPSAGRLPEVGRMLGEGRAARGAVGSLRSALLGGEGSGRRDGRRVGTQGPGRKVVS